MSGEARAVVEGEGVYERLQRRCGRTAGGDATATSFVNGCATDSSYVYLPTSGTALKDAFRAIGEDISLLRVSRKDAAEFSFKLFDHPRVYIFRRYAPAAARSH